MKYPRPFANAFLSAVLLMFLLSIVACQDKEERPWQYYGDASTAQTPPPAQAQATP